MSILTDLRSYPAWEQALQGARTGDVTEIGAAAIALQREIAGRASKMVHEDAIELLRAGQAEIRSGFDAVAQIAAIGNCLTSIDACLDAVRDLPGPDDPFWGKLAHEALLAKCPGYRQFTEEFLGSQYDPEDLVADALWELRGFAHHLTAGFNIHREDWIADQFWDEWNHWNA